MREKIHNNIHLFALCLLVLCISVSEYVTSISVWIMLTNWIFYFNYKEKWELLKKNRSVFILLLLFLTHIVWLLNTSNFSYALNDLRIKIPLLAFPVIIGSTKPISFNNLVIVIKFFVLGLLISTVSGLFAYYKIISIDNIDNFRNISIYISHIRLSLMLCLVIFIIAYFIYKKILTKKYEIFISILILCWFILFMLMIQAITGFVILLLISFSLIFIKILKEKIYINKFIYLGILIFIPLSILLYLLYFINDFYTPTQTGQGESIYTAKNNLYSNDFENNFIENGNYIYRDICEEELYEIWQTRSSICLDSLNNSNNKMLHVLLRYMASKGLKKDAEGIMQLTDKDIKAIESGVTNYRFKNSYFINNINKRLYSIIWQIDVYRKGGNPSGHSVTQRLEFLKAGLNIFGQNFWLGTGTGDLDDVYKKYYQESNTELKPEFWHRAHNQYLTLFITFGIFGAIICLIAIFLPVFMEKAIKNYYFMIFFAIALISMLNEDTLETMIGVFFFSFFYSLFLWGYKNEKASE